MTSITSAPLDLPDVRDVEELSRADLVFYGVDHSGPSYEARVFVNNPQADPATERVLEEGYAGSFTVFGHNGCFGDAGHCLPDQRTRDEFDVRAPHPLQPLTMTVIATDAIRRALVDPETTTVTVTVVAVVPEDDFPKAAEPAERFQYVRLLTYES
jgi:hypothetical protein